MNRPEPKAGELAAISSVSPQRGIDFRSSSLPSSTILTRFPSTRPRPSRWLSRICEPRSAPGSGALKG